MAIALIKINHIASHIITPWTKIKVLPVGVRPEKPVNELEISEVKDARK